MSLERSAVVEPHSPTELQGSAPPKRAGAVETVKAVMWSFFGVRGRAGHESDMERLNPVYVIAAGIMLAAVFVLSLIALVRWVVAQAAT